MIFRRVEVRGAVVDRVAVADGIDDEVDGAGGALIDGLWDHHVHLLAMAAAEDSVTVPTLRAAAATRPPGEWIRAVGYHECDHGELDRDTLDRIAPDHPVRVQHATGAMWVLNSAGLRAAGLASIDGRVLGRDAELRDRWRSADADLAPVSAALSAVGVTGVTDATPDLAALPLDGVTQRVRLLGRSKIVVADHAPPDVEDLADAIRDRRPGIVAVHCASRLALVLTLAALEIAGARPGDRIEHGAVIPEDALDTIRRLGLTVVTQPAFIAARGDRYLAEVERDDVPYLWRCGSLLRAGIPVALSTDAPYGPADPWQAIAAASTRRTGRGAALGEAEAISPRGALSLFAPPPGEAAGRCLLRVPLAEALAAPDASVVRATYPTAGDTLADRSGRLSGSKATTRSS